MNEKLLPLLQGQNNNLTELFNNEFKYVVHIKFFESLNLNVELNSLIDKTIDEYEASLLDNAELPNESGV